MPPATAALRVTRHLENAAHYRRLTGQPGAAEFPTADGHIIVASPLCIHALSADLDPCGFDVATDPPPRRPTSVMSRRSHAGSILATLRVAHTVPEMRRRETSASWDMHELPRPLSALVMTPNRRAATPVLNPVAAGKPRPASLRIVRLPPATTAAAATSTTLTPLRQNRLEGPSSRTRVEPPLPRHPQPTGSTRPTTTAAALATTGSPAAGPVERIAIADVIRAAIVATDPSTVNLSLRSATLPGVHAHSRLRVKRPPQERRLSLAFPSAQVAEDFREAVEAFVAPFASRCWNGGVNPADADGSDSNEDGPGHDPAVPYCVAPALLLNASILPAVEEPRRPSTSAQPPGGRTPNRTPNRTPMASPRTGRTTTTRADAWTHHANSSLIRDALVGAKTDTFRINLTGTTAPLPGGTYEPFINAVRSGANDAVGRRVRLCVDAVESFTDTVLHELVDALLERRMVLVSVVLRDCPNLGAAAFAVLAALAEECLTFEGFQVETTSVNETRPPAVERMIEDIKHRTQRNALATKYAPPNQQGALGISLAVAGGSSERT